MACNPKDLRERHLTENARALYEKRTPQCWPVHIFEAMRIGASGSATMSKEGDL
jgi:hypothetical protein